MRWVLSKIIFVIAGVALASPAFALTVSPARVEITGDPGTTIRGEIELLNEQEDTRTFYTSAENFEPSGTSGTPSFIGAKDDLATWIHVEEKVVLKSQERVVVPFLIAIPRGADPGGYFAAIFFGNQPRGAEGGGQVSVGGKVGVLILLRVSGAVTQSGGLVEFRTMNKQRFFSTLPITLTYQLNNTGGDRVMPLGEIRIKNTLWMQTATLVANETQGSVLPGSIRRFDVPWGGDAMRGFFTHVKRQWKDFHFGLYTATLDVRWGAGDQAAQRSFIFFIFPWQLIIVVLVLAFIAIYGVKQYNRWIISKVTKRT